MMTTRISAATEQLVLAELERQADFDGVVIAVQHEIASACGISIGSVVRAITHLLQEGVVLHEGYYNIPGICPSNPDASHAQGSGRLAILRLADSG